MEAFIRLAYDRLDSPESIRDFISIETLELEPPEGRIQRFLCVADVTVVGKYAQKITMKCSADQDRSSKLFKRVQEG
jgi:hypothetical protein